MAIETEELLEQYKTSADELNRVCKMELQLMDAKIKATLIKEDIRGVFVALSASNTESTGRPYFSIRAGMRV